MKLTHSGGRRYLEVKPEESIKQDKAETNWHDDWHFCFNGNFHSTGVYYMPDAEFKKRTMEHPEDPPAS